jgi:hypothetical protein
MLPGPRFLVLWDCRTCDEATQAAAIQGQKCPIRLRLGQGLLSQLRRCDEPPWLRAAACASTIKLGSAIRCGVGSSMDSGGGGALEGTTSKTVGRAIGRFDSITVASAQVPQRFS